MSAIAVAAVDGPNVHRLLKDLYGNQRVDYASLRQHLRSDAQERFGGRFDWRAAVLLQGQAVNSMTPDSIAARMAFAEYLAGAGWPLIEKDPSGDYPFELIDANRLLKRAMTVPAQITRSELLELGARGRFSDEDLGNLREATSELKAYRQTFTARRWLMLRAIIATLSALKSRRTLVKVLARTYGSIAQMQAKQDVYYAGIRSALAHYFENFEVPDGASRQYLDACEPQELMRLARRVEKEQSTMLTALRHERDVDALLSEWVLEKIKPDPTKLPRHPAVTYLVGGDYRNFLPLAERMKRYGVQPVFVTFERQLDQASLRTRQEVGVYPCIWLEQFLVKPTDKDQDNGLVA